MKLNPLFLPKLHMPARTQDKHLGYAKIRPNGTFWVSERSSNYVGNPGVLPYFQKRLKFATATWLFGAATVVSYAELFLRFKKILERDTRATGDCSMCKYSLWAIGVGLVYLK